MSIDVGTRVMVCRGRDYKTYMGTVIDIRPLDYLVRQDIGLENWVCKEYVRVAQAPPKPPSPMGCFDHNGYKYFKVDHHKALDMIMRGNHPWFIVNETSGPIELTCQSSAIDPRVTYYTRELILTELEHQAFAWLRTIADLPARNDVEAHFKNYLRVLMKEKGVKKCQ